MLKINIKHNYNTKENTVETVATCEVKSHHMIPKENLDHNEGLQDFIDNELCKNLLNFLTSSCISREYEIVDSRDYVDGKLVLHIGVDK